MSTINEVVALGGDVSDSGNGVIALDQPYRVAVRLVGDAAILFHRWQSDAVDAKAAAAKGSEAKKTDDLESYVWRNEEGNLCLPGEYVRGSLIDPRNGAAKYQQDPRSSRKSALDLFRAGVISTTELGELRRVDGSVADHWEYVDRRRVRVQSAAVTRSRPALSAGWSVEVEFMVMLPQYINPRLLHRTLVDAGRLVGVADFRPTFGRYSIAHFEVLSLD